MKVLFTLLLTASLASLSSCASNTPAAPTTGGTGNVSRTIQNTASTVGIFRNLQSIFRSGF